MFLTDIIRTLYKIICMTVRNTILQNPFLIVFLETDTTSSVDPMSGLYRYDFEVLRCCQSQPVDSRGCRNSRTRRKLYKL